MKRARAILALLAGGAVALAGTVALAAPALGAYLCPPCYGFEHAGNGIYAQREDDPHPLDDLYWAARDRTLAGFEGVADLPDAALLFCDDRECDARFGLHGAKAQTYGARFVVVASTGTDLTILSHEMAHLVLHGAAGAVRLVSGDLPAWRNEGVAALVSRDARYFDFDAQPPACLHEPGADLPETNADWARAMRPDTHERLYSEAACAVFRAHGLPPYDPETLLRGNG